MTTYDYSTVETLIAESPSGLTLKGVSREEAYVRNKRSVGRPKDLRPRGWFERQKRRCHIKYSIHCHPIGNVS